MISLSEAMELSGSEIMFIKAGETVDEVVEEARLVSNNANEDVVACVLTTSRALVLATVKANEVVDDEAEVMVVDKADDRAREVDSTARAHEILLFSDDNGGGASISDSVETYGENMEERSGEDDACDLSATIPTRFAEFLSEVIV